MWQNGNPKDSGWYLGAWKMGETYIYQVAKWTGTEWYASMQESPTTWQEIDCPELQYEMLNELNQHKTQTP